MIKLEYSILLLDQSEEDQINFSLRQLGSKITTFKNLDSLWQSIFVSPPSAIIIDIRKMNTEEKTILSHPIIKNKNIPLILFYRDSDLPILRNIELDNFYDKIKMAPSYSEDLKRITNQVNCLLSKEIIAQELKQTLDLKDIEIENLKKDNIKIKSNEIYRSIGYLFIQRFFHQLKLKKNFIPSLAGTIEDFSFIENYILFEIDSEKQKVRSNNISTKSKVIPSFNVEENLTNAYFKNHITKTCTSITVDLFGKDSIICKIEEMPGKVKFILGMKISKEYLKFVDNEFISKVLSSELQRFADKNLIKNVIKPLWDLLPWADRIKKDIDVRNILYLIDLSDLKKTAQKNFHWNLFFEDFINGINQVTNGEAQIFNDGFSKLYIVLDYTVDIKFLMHYLDEFMVWNYFEDENNSIGKIIELSLKRINLKETELNFFGETIPTPLKIKINERDLGRAF